MKRLVVLSGCSGGGKSTLLAEMSRRGWATVPEPGRRIIAEGGPMPWDDPRGFALSAIEMALGDVAASGTGTTLFDRSALDALAYLDLIGADVPDNLRRDVGAIGYASPVYLVPPWPEIYTKDNDRRHGLDAAMAEYDHMQDWLAARGFAIGLIPKGSVEARADWLETALRA